MGEEGTGRSDSQTAKSPSAGRYIDPLPEQGRRIAPNKKEKQRRTDVEGGGGGGRERLQKMSGAGEWRNDRRRDTRERRA